MDCQFMARDSSLLQTVMNLGRVKGYSKSDRLFALLRNRRFAKTVICNPRPSRNPNPCDY